MKNVDKLKLIKIVETVEQWQNNFQPMRTLRHSKLKKVKVHYKLVWFP